MPATARDMAEALLPAERGLLAKTAARVDGDDNESAFLLVRRAEDALSWRLALADAATESLDLQYFRWEGDAAGTLLFARVIEAAERAVRVRLLVDDLALRTDEEQLVALDQHTNIAINRWDPARSDTSRRMHNKMLLADGRFAITGGRNVTNADFGLEQKHNFLDLEVLAAGPIVTQMSDAFDAYWASSASVSVSEASRASRLASLAQFVSGERAFLEEKADLLSRFPLERQEWEQRFEYLPERWHLGRALWVQDDPVATADDELRLGEIVDLSAAPVESELYVAGAYLIPVGDLYANLKQLVASGVDVKVVTGTMEAVNHTAAYAHYRRGIDAILDAGAELYEVDGQPLASLREAADTPPVQGEYVAFHLKGIVGDRDKIFIGSLDFDPRTLVIDTEAGLYVESAGLGGELAGWYDEVTAPGNAWRVSKDDVTGRLTWTSGDRVRDRSPDRGPFQRFAADFLETLPVRDQL